MTRRTLFIGVGLALVLAAGPWLVDAYWLRILTSVFMFAIVTQGLNVIVGITGYHAFGNAAFFGIGAYTTGVAMQLGAPFPLALAAAPPACAVVAAVLGWPILRLRGHYFAIATVALNLAMIEAIPAIGGITGGAEGLALPLSEWEPGPLYIALYWTMLGGMVAATVLVAWLLRTRLGYALRAIRDSERAAGVVGIDTRRAKVAAWSISAAITGFAGGVWAYWITFIEPGSAFDPAIGVRAYIMLIIGGMGTVFGPIFGAFFLELLSTLVWANLLRGHQLVLGVLIVVVCLAAPNGLADAVRRALRSVRMPEPILEARDVSVFFGGVRALDRLSFAVQPGEVFGVIGPNGAGKTTLLNTISAVYRPRTGAVLVDGVPITGLPPHKLAKLGVARTFQIVQPFAHMTVRENVLVGALFGTAVKHDAHAAAESALERTGLLAKSAFLPPQLTLAERKRLEVARALAMRPRILLLDEVMAGLNHTEIERVITLIKQLQADGLTVIVVEHVMRAVLALCSRLMVLNFGAMLAEGPAAEVVTNPLVVEAYLGSRFARMRVA